MARNKLQTCFLRMHTLHSNKGQPIRKYAGDLLIDAYVLAGCDLDAGFFWTFGETGTHLMPMTGVDAMFTRKKLVYMTTSSWKDWPLYFYTDANGFLPVTYAEALEIVDALEVAL